MVRKNFFKKLTGAVGADNVLLAVGDLALYASDAKVTGIPPIMAARPVCASEVQAVMRL